jgi:signal transduction histidine kinase/CheY-like chemotaxis protein/HAMP domain-containing protein
MTDVAHDKTRLDEPALAQLLAGLTAVRGGDFSTRLAQSGDPLMDEIATVFNGMVDQLDLFTSEVTRVAREVGTEGKLGGQAYVPGVSGTWKDLTESVNAMADNLTSQVRSIAKVTTAVARGDLSQKIRVDARGEILELKDTINTMVDQLSAFADEVTRVAREVGTQGNLGGQAVVHGVAGIWKDLTDNVNSMADNLTSQVRNIAQVTTAVARGDLSKKIDVEARGEILELKTTINTMVDQLSSFAAEVTRVAREVGREGRLGGQAEVEGVSGTWKRLTENVNELARNLTVQVRAIAEVTSAVAAGDLTRTIDVGAQGEVAELKDNINAMVGSLRETTLASEQQDWLKTNLARIAGMMQGHRDLEIVAEVIMDELAPLAGAQHGTFFLSEGDQSLRLIAGYGLRADKDAPVEYRLGQSLIGQVAKSKRSVFVSDLPPGYVKISSGLGEAAPAHLAILPVMFEDYVLGVIELASFSEFTQVQRTLLEQVTETLGVSVNSIIANSRTDALLEESQRLAAELQAQQAEIEERARQLALASKYKSQFLANMSHELRTPLNSLLILARLLAQNPGRNLTAKQVEYANVIHSAGSDLLRLINDILDLSKVEAGRLDVRPESFPLASLLDEVRATFQPLTAEKGLDFSIVDQGPAELVTDRQRLRQVLGNLLSNAVKFTQRGGVVLTVDIPRSGVVAFSVTDTGIGIPRDNLETIFGAFQQGDGTMSRRYGGTGLGLSIAREVCSLLGGELTAESEPGRGSTFTLLLPVALPDLTEDSDPPAPDLPAPGLPAPAGEPLPSRERRVLVIEGNSGGLLTLLAHSAVSDVAGAGAPVRVETMATVDDAFAALTSRPFRCVVLDLGLEDSSTSTFLERLEETPELGAIPVLAHTRGAPSRLARLRFGSGPLELLPSLDELRERITLHVSTGLIPPLAGDVVSPAPAPDTPAAGHEDLSGKRVLVVDDDTRNVFAITSALEQYGMIVDQAPDGRAGIEALRREPVPDLVLMDVMMPEMDGYATMTTIRQMPEFEHLPIIAVTARAMPGDRDKSLAAGATDYVTKPVDTDELLVRMKRWLNPGR